jgi:hypothetical protein
MIVRDYASIEFRGTLPRAATVVPDGVKVDSGKRGIQINGWKWPPHVAFANRSFKTLQDAKRFVEEYGFSYAWTRGFKLDETILDLRKIQKEQEKLRGLWGKAGTEYALSSAEIHFINGKPKITLSDIRKYTNAFFLIDASAGRLAVCAWPDCPELKYFVKERRDQRFCSRSCKNAFHVNLWLANPENRKAWNAHRRKLAKSKALTKSERNRP